LPITLTREQLSWKTNEEIVGPDLGGQMDQYDVHSVVADGEETKNE
jgi:hypothetical protein